MRILILLLSLSLCHSALASWVLDNNQSRLSIISTKKNNVAEVHHFAHLSGAISNSAQAQLTIDLSSVDTQIAVRDQRIKKWLFNTQLFPNAIFSTQLDEKILNNLTVGENTRLTLKGKIKLHGIEKPLATDVMVVKLQNNQLLVTTIQPIVIKAGTFGLAKGIEKLREIAKLPSISHAVPVSFMLIFTPAK